MTEQSQSKYAITVFVWFIFVMESDSNTVFARKKKYRVEQSSAITQTLTY